MTGITLIDLRSRRGCRPSCSSSRPCRCHIVARSPAACRRSVRRPGRERRPSCSRIRRRAPTRPDRNRTLYVTNIIQQAVAFLTFISSFKFSHCALASCGGVYCKRSCLWVCGAVTTITRNSVHRSSPNWVCR